MAINKIITVGDLNDIVSAVDEDYILSNVNLNNGCSKQRLLDNLVRANFVTLRWLNGIPSNKLVKREDFYLEAYTQVTNGVIFIDKNNFSYGNLSRVSSSIRNNFLNMSVKGSDGATQWIKFGKGGVFKIEAKFDYNTGGSGSSDSFFDFYINKVESSSGDIPTNITTLRTIKVQRGQSINQVVSNVAINPGQGIQFYFDYTTSKSHEYKNSANNIKIIKTGD